MNDHIKYMFFATGGFCIFSFFLYIINTFNFIKSLKKAKFLRVKAICDNPFTYYDYYSIDQDFNRPDRYLYTKHSINPKFKAQVFKDKNKRVNMFGSVVNMNWTRYGKKNFEGIYKIIDKSIYSGENVTIVYFEHDTLYDVIMLSSKTMLEEIQAYYYTLQCS